MNPLVAIIWSFTQTAWDHARTAAKDEKGSATLETVLWYVAAGLGVVAVAAVLWTAIKAKASEPLPTPTAP